MINRIIFLLLFLTVVTTWCTQSFAQQVVNSSAPLSDGVGVPQGATLTGAVTLTVGNQNVFTNNSNNGSVVAPTLAAIFNNTASSGFVTFNGNSNVFGTVGQAGVVFNNISGGANGDTVNFLGDVYSTTLNVTGTGSVHFNSGSTNITATNFSGDGTIGLAPNTTVIGALTTNTADTGTLALGGGSVLDGAVGGANGLKAISVVGGNNTAGVSATITGATNAYSFNLGTNTLNVNGALAINNPGPDTINTTLASSTLFGHIVSVGAVTLPATLGVNVTVPSTAYFPVGTQFNIVQATSGTNGSVVAVTIQDPTNPLYTFSAVPLAGTLNGLVEIRTTSIPLQAAAADPVVPVLLTIPLTPDLTNVLAATNALTDPAAVTNAVIQFSPSATDLGAPLVTFQGTQQFQNLWLSRLDDTMCGQVSQPDQAGQLDKESSTCRHNNPGSGWWLKGFGEFGTQGSQEGFAGYNSNIVGTMAAYDVPLSHDTRVGLGVGYARSTINGETFNTTTSFNTYQATAYIGHERGPWFVDGNVSFGWNDYSDTRNISFPGVERTAQGNYSGQDYTGFVNAGYHFFAQKYTITPLASLQYTHMNLDGYTETGAGDIDLKVNSQSYDFLESGLGVKVTRDLSYRDGTYLPEVHLKWLHELDNPTLENTASFTAAGSSSFTTSGLNPADDTLDLGAGLTFLSCSCTAKTWALEGVYDYYWADNSHSNQAMIKLTSRF